MDDPADDIEVIQLARKKLVMDFRSQTRRPERVTVEVLREMVRRDTDKMSLAARRWLGEERKP